MVDLALHCSQLTTLHSRLHFTALYCTLTGQDEGIQNGIGGEGKSWKTWYVFSVHCALYNSVLYAAHSLRYI